MARTRDVIMRELRDTQKQLLTAKSRRNAEKARYCRVHLADLQKEYEAAM